MFTIKADNFDTLTPPALPAGFVSSGTMPFVSVASSAISAPNALTKTQHASVSTLWWDAADGSSGNAAMSIGILPTSLANAFSVDAFLRGTMQTGTPADSCYLVRLTFDPLVGATFGLIRRVAGVETPIGTTSVPAAIVTVAYTLQLSASGQTITAKFIRASDGFHLNNAGAWTSSAVNVASAVDTVISGEGRAGIRYLRPTAAGAVNFDDWLFEAESQPTTAVPSYLTIAEAEAIAGSLYGLSAWATATASDKLRAVVTASSRIDASRRWQGRAYDLDAEGNAIVPLLAFPRIDVDGSPIARDPSNPTSLVPVVPPQIRQAVVWEADSLLKGARRARLQARHDGLASQEIGSALESYRPLAGADGTPILCIEADTLVRPFTLRSGRLL